MSTSYRYRLNYLRISLSSTQMKNEVLIVSKNKIQSICISAWSDQLVPESSLASVLTNTHIIKCVPMLTEFVKNKSRFI